MNRITKELGQSSTWAMILAISWFVTYVYSYCCDMDGLHVWFAAGGLCFFSGVGMICRAIERSGR